MPSLTLMAAAVLPSVLAAFVLVPLRCPPIARSRRGGAAIEPNQTERPVRQFEQ
jgi:hypothetical protein